MNILIASDIHGNYEYTKKIESILKSNNITKLILLGDLYYHGPRNPLPDSYNPLKVSEILNKYKDIITCVRGNCDAEVDDMISDFSVTKDYEELTIANKMFLVTHGHLLDNLKDKIKHDYILSGHTHLYNLTDNNINPGSVGIPFDNREHTCILIEDSIIKLIDLDTKKVLKEKEII